MHISNKRFSNAAYKQGSVPGIAITDQRGKHEPGNKISEDMLESVRCHIRSFPTFRSHYSRKDAPHKKYLSPDLNVGKMYSLYVIKCKDDSVTPVKEPIYRRIFNYEFNLSFYKLRIDTCNTCDRLDNAVKSEKNNENYDHYLLKKICICGK